eukprot:Nitzschia sp. Nitz4//scaffold162_size51285//38109//39260//NITZ4_006975-RA/size51285-processed-gene-0.90-mRNA-1//1//CDS//3329537991//6492//frame0
MPPYYSKPMPANPKKIMDEHEEETTRRVGGRGGAPTMVAPSMGAMPMPMGFGASINTAPMKAQAAAAPVSTSKFVWSLSEVPTLPEFHPLERTAVFCPNASASVVAARISDLLRERSIEAFYDDDKAKVKCVTTDGVDFRIRLYRGRNQYSHGIIVEVQRRFGFSIHFHADTQAILDTAQGKIPTPPPMQRGALPEVSDDDDDDDDEDFCPPPSSAATLSMVEKMLSLPGFDAQYLGLQTLSTLVDADKMTTQTARKTAAALLKQDSKVGQQVFQYIVNRKEDESYASLRVMCLGILANSMRASSIVPEYLRAPLRPALLKDLYQAKEHPNAALLAARCMEYYIRGDLDSIELNDAFQAARDAGEARHASLMEQADRCIASIR